VPERKQDAEVTTGGAMKAAMVNIPSRTLSRQASGRRRTRIPRTHLCTHLGRADFYPNPSPAITKGIWVYAEAGFGMRVLLADDHALVRAGIRALLVALPEVESVT